MSQGSNASEKKNCNILTTRIHCIVKLGGAAITQKTELETINESILAITALQLREAMEMRSPFVKMDWSRGNTSAEDVNMQILSLAAVERHLDFPNAFVVVHGAGSFGHFQASRSGVQRGDLNTPLVKAGLVATRISVTKLNHEVVRHFASEGIPAVGISPLSAGWCTKNKNFKEDDMTAVECTVNAGFIPVVHGDGVLDSAEGCSILSGDLIVRQLAKGLKPSFVVFLTNVPGVFDQPPSEPNAVLLKEIGQTELLWWISPCNAVQITVAAHDTTGGMAGKISEAAFIAAMGIDVYIVQAGTPHALEALKGNVKCSESKKRWIGTLVRSAQSKLLA
ncbi:unnamed protein product [Sphagnum troendelagicum]|uniref:Isopentenyl phosphate kinase n=1 Tax=Sphagnum troendelagicum TaxID=128251 RepID=A0ABP0UF75_9BRYO